MTKFLLMVVVIAGALWWLWRRVGSRGASSSRSARDAAADKTRSEDMVACVHCGVHLPRGEAVVDGEATYCSRAHQLAGPGPAGRP